MKKDGGLNQFFLRSWFTLDEGIGDYIGKFCGLSQRLANMGRICENWWLLYLLFSGLGDEHSTWATLFCNASRKEADAPLLNIVTSLLLDKFQLISKPGNIQSMALFGSTSRKHRFNSSFSTHSNRTKSTYNKATAKCTHCNKSFQEAVNCWLLHSELVKAR